jgi:hypothetical protein
MQALVKHSQDKDQFLKVAIKQMQETQIFEDELKEVSKLNSVLLNQNQELEAKLAKESQAKDGKPPLLFFLRLDQARVNPRLTVNLFCKVQGSTYGPCHHSW